MGWNPRLGVQGQVYAPNSHLFSMYARLYVLLGCIHVFWSVYWQFHVCIWDVRCFSAITDVPVDYLTNFYNKIEGIPGFITMTHRDECTLCEHYA